MFVFRLIGNCRDTGEDFGVLGGLCPPNTPRFLPHPSIPREPVFRVFWNSRDGDIVLLADRVIIPYLSYLWDIILDRRKCLPHSFNIQEKEFIGMNAIDVVKAGLAASESGQTSKFSNSLTTIWSSLGQCLNRLANTNSSA